MSNGRKPAPRAMAEEFFNRALASGQRNASSAKVRNFNP